MYLATDYDSARQRLARQLFGVGAVLTSDSDHPLVIEHDGPNGKERGFKLKLHERQPDAPLSPYYFMFRTSDNPKPGPLTPEVVRLGAHCLHAMAFRDEIHCNAVAGLPNAGTKFAEEFAEIPFRLPLLVLRKEDLPDGKRRIILPDEMRTTLRPGSTVAVIDDLVNEADTKFEGIQAVEGAGRNWLVRDVLVLVDREQGGAQEIAKRGYRLHAVFTTTELLEEGARLGCITTAMLQKIQQYRETVR